MANPLNSHEDPPESDVNGVSRHQPRGRLSWLSLQHMEVLLLAITLLATVVISWLTLNQTTHHFRLERTGTFVSRFNSTELVSLRESVDRWLEGTETIDQLFDRAKGISDPASNPRVSLGRADAVLTISNLRTLTNFFQEFGTALKSGVLDEKYAHDLLGGVCIRYGNELEPFIVRMRIERKRDTVYQEVFLLRNKMLIFDGKPPLPLPDKKSP